MRHNLKIFNPVMTLTSQVFPYNNTYTKRSCRSATHNGFFSEITAMKSHQIYANTHYFLVRDVLQCATYFGALTFLSQKPDALITSPAANTLSYNQQVSTLLVQERVLSGTDYRVQKGTSATHYKQ